MALTFNGKEINIVKFNNNVGYEKVGNPTIVDGVASGFSADNYLQLTQNPSYKATDEIEWNTKFTTSSSIAIEWVFAFNDPTTASMKGIYYVASRVYVLYCPDKTLDLTYSLQTNTTYSVNFKKDSSGNLTAQLKDENGNVLKTATQTEANVAMSYNTRRIGLGFSTGNSGSIDLNETYVKVNGITWFSGKQHASKEVNYVIKDGKLVWTSPNL